MNRITLLLVGSVLPLSVHACASSHNVPFEGLVSNPERYHGRQVCTEGIYATGFETNALGASLRREGEAVYLTEPAIWIEGAAIRSSTDCVDSGAFPSARFCKATVCGLFESGGNYGHLGGVCLPVAGRRQVDGYHQAGFPDGPGGRVKYPGAGQEWTIHQFRGTVW